MRTLLYLSALSAGVALTGCTTSTGDWHRGNTHAHTVLCGHADSTPEEVASWYLDNRYNFLILSEHNKFIDPATVKLPANRRDDFILVPGEEVTGNRRIHTTAMNVDRLVPWKFTHEHRSKMIQKQVDDIHEAGGHTILNHPNWHYSVNLEDVLPVKGLYMFELYNGSPDCNDFGDKDHDSLEVMWDKMLTKGMTMYGVASDDAHILKEISPAKSNPGRGWVMVHSEKLTPDALTHAMRHGDFYSSSGVFLKLCEKSRRRYTVEADAVATAKELEINNLLRGQAAKESEEGWLIEFIGPGGKVLKAVNDVRASIDVDKSQAYIRARVTLTKTHPVSGGFEKYYAWGQPVFTDGREMHSAHDHSDH